MEQHQSNTMPVTDTVMAFTRRFIRFPHPSIYRLYALWIINTYMYEDFDYCPYFFVYSPDPESGKSITLEISSALSFNSAGVTIDPTEAYLFRDAKGRPQFLDEIDQWAAQEYCRAVLNSGFKRGAKVPRMKKTESEAGSDYVAEYFDVYSPRMLAGLGHDVLAPATRTRCLSVRMPKSARGEMEKFRDRVVADDIKSIQEQIAAFIETKREHIRAYYDYVCKHGYYANLDPEYALPVPDDVPDEQIEEWLKQNPDKITKTPRTGGFPYLQQFSGRTEDILEGLAAILEIEYADRPDYDNVVQEFMQAVEITRKEASTVTRDREIFSALLRLAEKSDPLIGMSAELSQWCKEIIGEDIAADEISRLLLRYEFEQASKRQRSFDSATKEGPRRRFIVPSEKLRDILRTL